MLPSRPPFSHFGSLDPPYQAPETLLPFFEKNLAFQDQFLPILTKFSAPETQIVAKFCSGDRSLSKKISSIKRRVDWKWAITGQLAS